MKETSSFESAWDKIDVDEKRTNENKRKQPGACIL
jgi:hypothetical protein